ncbi:MAG: hypothetical protein ACREAQ_05465 [Nitrososphaera sp.]
MPKRKIKEGKPQRRLGKKELLIVPIAMGGATLVALVIIPAFAPPPDPANVCLRTHNVETFQLFPRILVLVDGQMKLLPDDVGKQPKNGQECLRPLHTDKAGNELHIEYIRPIRFTMADLMKIYSYDNSTITVADNATGTITKQTLELDKYNVAYSYFSAEAENCDTSNLDDPDCYSYPGKLSEFPPFTKDMLARIELTSKQ